MKSVSIIIPAYNEEARLPATLEKIQAYFAAPRPFSLHEVIVVDDGSRDGTIACARRFKGSLPMKIISVSPNRGKGHAVKKGMLASAGDYAFMYDADAATPIEELARLMERTDKADVVIGSRVGGEKEVVMTRFRRFVGWCFHTLCAPLLPGIEDASCGAKLWSRRAAEKVFNDVRLDRFAFDIESLWLAMKYGFAVAEVRVNWTAVEGSKVSIYRDSPEMFLSVLGLYIRRLRESAFLRRHALACILAILVGIVYISPHLLFTYAPDVEYRGIYMSRTYDEDYYNNIIHQVYDKAPVTQNPYNSEYGEKSVSTLYNIPQAIVGWIGRIFNLPFDTLAIFCKFLFPALNFLVVYGLVLYLTKKKSFALLGATAMLLAQEIAPISITALIDTFSFNSPFHHFLLFSRPINPQVNAIFFFLTLWALAALWHQPERKRYAWLAGIATGILGYLYFFYWNFTTILLGIMFVASLCMRDRMRMKKVLAALGISLVVALPYLITMIEMLGAGTASVGKNYILTHRVIIEKIMLFPLALLGVMMAWKYIKYRSIKLAHPFQFLLLLVLAGIAASNQQVIHGMEIQQHHYHFMTNIPVFIIVMSILVAMAIERYCHKYVRPTIALLVILLFFQAASIQAASYKYWKPIFAEYQAYAPVFEWLNKNSAYNDIIYASETISQLIPTYTHDDVYSALHLSVYPVPLERLEHNYFIYMYLEGIRENTVRDYLFKEENRNRIGQHLFEGQYWRAMCGSFGCFPDSVIEDLIIKYKNFLKKPFEQNFKKYRVNYVMWDSRENPEWNVSKHSFLELATSTDGVLLFSVR